MGSRSCWSRAGSIRIGSGPSRAARVSGGISRNARWPPVIDVSAKLPAQARGFRPATAARPIRSMPTRWRWSRRAPPGCGSSDRRCDGRVAAAGRSPRRARLETEQDDQRDSPVRAGVGARRSSKVLDQNRAPLSRHRLGLGNFTKNRTARHETAVALNTAREVPSTVALDWVVNE